MSDETLERLKLKYQSVLNKIQQSGVQLLNLHVEQGKLVIRGHAKTKPASDEVWNQIKLVDPNYASDLMAEIGYDMGPPTPATPAKPVEPRTYTVAKGDTLSAIANKVYGKASEYRRIFEANRDQLSDPDQIRPGQVLKLPE